VAEEVVLAADLLVEDLAAGGGFGGGFGGGGFSGGGSVEVGNRLCKHSITKKSCKLQLFFFYLSMSLLAKNTSFIFYTGKFLLSTSRVPFLIY
jgi:hypothetical protein